MAIEVCPDVCNEGKYCAQRGSVRFISDVKTEGKLTESKISIDDCLREKGIPTIGIIRHIQEFFPKDNLKTF